MSEEIPLEHLSDRELLLFACRSVNDHAKRIEINSEKIKALELWRHGIVAIGTFVGGLLSIHAAKHQ